VSLVIALTAVGAGLLTKPFYEMNRADQECGLARPPDANGYRIEARPQEDAFLCIYERDGRPTGKRKRVRSSDL
jgi:hypothetical protein